MDADQYNAGFNAYFNGLPLNPSAHPHWVAGWNDASIDHLIP